MPMRCISRLRCTYCSLQEELRQCGDAEAKVYLEQAQQLGVRTVTRAGAVTFIDTVAGIKGRSKRHRFFLFPLLEFSKFQKQDRDTSSFGVPQLSFKFFDYFDTILASCREKTNTKKKRKKQRRKEREKRTVFHTTEACPCYEPFRARPCNNFPPVSQMLLKLFSSPASRNGIFQLLPSPNMLIFKCGWFTT